MIDSRRVQMSWIYYGYARFPIVVLVKLTSEWSSLNCTYRSFTQLVERGLFPTLRHWTDFGLLLRLAAQAAGEEGLHRGAFEEGLGRGNGMAFLFDLADGRAQESSNCSLCQPIEEGYIQVAQCGPVDTGKGRTCGHSLQGRLDVGQGEVQKPRVAVRA